jgi:hypothetical protein
LNIKGKINNTVWDITLVADIGTNGIKMLLCFANSFSVFEFELIFIKFEQNEFYIDGT